MEDRINTFHTDQTITPMSASLRRLISIQSVRGPIRIPKLLAILKGLVWKEKRKIYS
jgi:hypothetical protein